MAQRYALSDIGNDKFLYPLSYFVEQLGEITNFIPTIHNFPCEVSKGQNIGSIECAVGFFPIQTPVTGMVKSFNEELLIRPDLISEGTWLFRIHPKG